MSLNPHDKLSNLGLRLHHPLSEGPVLYFDKRREDNFSAYCTIIKDGPTQLHFGTFSKGKSLYIKLQSIHTAEAVLGLHKVFPDE